LARQLHVTQDINRLRNLKLAALPQPTATGLRHVKESDEEEIHNVC
jgi:hypothetical protein